MTHPVTRHAFVVGLFSAALGACGSDPADETSGGGGTPDTGGAVVGGTGPTIGGAPSSGGVGGGDGGGGSGGTPGTGGGSGIGGSIGTGARPASGGASITGGASSTGGASATGGTPATGGTSATGSAPGFGGTLATGGAPGSGAGGMSGSAGQGGMGEAPPCATTLALNIGDNQATLQHEGRSRRYIVYVPGSIALDGANPLVLDFHGSGDTAARQESWSGWREKADQEGFVVVYPEGVGNTWNVGSCCGQALAEDVDDVGFARALIEAVSAVVCIDPRRVYATGMSNGAGFVHRLACEAADVIAAIAAASADLVTDPCTPARPISELSVRGIDDTMVAYEGGNTGSTGWYSPGAVGTLELWKEIDGCTGAAQTSREHCETYSSCSDGVEVTLCSLPGTGHGLYENPVGFDVPAVAWEMFERQSRPLR